MRGTARNTRGRILAINGVEDHVHLLAMVKPDMPVAKFVGTIKANSSRWVSRTFPALEFFAWQSGYSSFTVSESNSNRVAQYVEKQEEHHRKVLFEDELAALLQRHGLEFDARSYLD